MTAQTAAPPGLSADFRPLVWPDVIVDRGDGACFLLHPYEPRWAMTNETGVALARSMDGSRSLAEMASEAAARHGIPRDQAFGDLALFAEQLYDANLLRNLPLRNEKFPPRVREPHRLTIYLTEECNLRCRHCFIVEGKMPAPKLSADDVRAMIDAHAEKHPGALIVFSGGEVMLRDDCLELLAHAYKRTRAVNVNTNGLLIEDEATARAVVETRAGIQVSLDGADPEVHEFIRGRGTWKRTMRALELLHAVGGSQRVRIGTTLTKCALPQVKDLVAFAESLDLYEIRFLILNRLKAAETHWDEISPDPRELMEIYRWLLLELPRSGRRSRTRIQGDFPGFVPYPDPAGKHWCPIGETTIVDSQGNTYGCPTLMTPEYRTGRVEDGPLEETARGRRHRALREKMLSRRYAVPECRSCAWRNFCQGGCMAFSELRTGSPWINDEFCEFRRELYRRHAQLDAEHGPAFCEPPC